MVDSIVVCPRKVLVGKRLEIGGRDEHGHSNVVVVEEVIERGKAGVSAFEGFGGGE